MNPKYDGYIDVQFGAATLHHEAGALVHRRAAPGGRQGPDLMLQIAHKSMLMDVKAGRRLVDDCVHEKRH